DRNTLSDSSDIECDEKTGSCYILEAFGGIYKLSPEGDLSLFAGQSTNGNLESLGDGGQVEKASLGFLSGLARDPISGDIYISESSSNKIRRIARSGIITAVAGNGIYGAPQEGQPALSQPLGLSGDIAGIAMAARDGILTFVNIVFGDNGNQNFIFQI